MLQIEPKRTLKRIVIVAAVVLGVVGAGAATWQIARMNVRPSTVADVPVEQKPVPKSVESRMLVMGNIYWGRYINDWSQASPQKYAYPFQIHH